MSSVVISTQVNSVLRDYNFNVQLCVHIVLHIHVSNNFI